MASRQEEKERRRREREQAERAAAARDARRKRIGIVAGGVLVAAIAVVVVLAVSSGGDEGSSASAGGSAALPARQIEDLRGAADAAGCEVSEHRSEGQQHTTEDVRYRTNPPTSGNHDPTASREGVYAPGSPPDTEQSVHALEHGRVLIQYKPATPQPRIDQLQQLFEEEVSGVAGYKTLVFQNQTGMDAAVAATSWTKSLTCPSWNDQVFDAIRAFREENVDKAPEAIPSEFE